MTGPTYDGTKTSPGEMLTWWRDYERILYARGCYIESFNSVFLYLYLTGSPWGIQIGDHGTVSRIETAREASDRFNKIAYGIEITRPQ